MKLNKIVILAMLLGLASFSAHAQDIPEFKKIDTNADKSVDEAEFAAATAAGVKKSLADLDTNSDGKLDRAEYSVVLDADCE